MEEPYLKEFKEKAAGRVLTPDFTLETNHRKNESARRPSICFRG